MKPSTKPLVPFINADVPRLGGSDALLEASPEELRILLCLLETGRVDDGSVKDLARAAGCGVARAKSALRYWQEVGVLVAEDEAVTAPPSEHPAPSEPQTVAEKPKPKKPLRPCTEGREVTSAEAAAIIRDRDLSAFINTCQATVGREFNTRELTILTGLVNDLPFSEEYLLTLISYCQKKAKRFSFPYLEKTAYSMLDRELLTLEELNGYLIALDRFASEEWQLRRLFGIGERRLTKTEQDHFMRWTTEFGYGEEIVGIAYDIAVDRLGKISYSYINKLLSRFHEAGCKTEEEVQIFLERERAEHAAKPISQHTGAPQSKKSGQKPAPSAQKTPAAEATSYKADDFFAAALRRSFGDDGEE